MYLTNQQGIHLYLLLHSDRLAENFTPFHDGNLMPWSAHTE